VEGATVERQIDEGRGNVVWDFGREDPTLSNAHQPMADCRG
jgi:hypothetical protein